MIPNLPAYITIIFLFTVLLALWFLWKASFSVPAVLIPLLWMAVTGILAYKGFFLHLTGMPPRIALAVLPMLLLIVLLLTTKKGQQFTGSLNMKTLVLLSIVRVPVELCLYWLCQHKAVPELMTFAGRNFDIISGLTAPLVFFACFKGREVHNKKLLLAWNIMGLVLLLNIVINAILSLPLSFQQFAFDQPNIAILYFPFVWLPSFIVMLVLFSHLVMIKRLLNKQG